MSRYESQRISAIIALVGGAALFVVFAVEGLWIDVAIIAGIGLLVGLFVLGSGVWASNVTRRLEAEVGEFPDEPREPSEAMLAVDAFDEAIHDARAVPLTDQIRLDRGEAERLLERLRTALPPGSSVLSSLLSELDELVRNAKPIPLTNEIRLERDDVYDILDRMRASFAAAQ